MNEQKTIVKEAAKDIQPMKSPVTIRITYYEGKATKRQRVRDLDNVIGGGNKFILDALKDMGIIIDDSADHVSQLFARGFKATGDPRIEIILESED